MIDHRCRLARGLRRASREIANFFCNNGETLASLACTRSFDRRVECEQIRLKSDLIDDLDDLCDFAARRLDLFHRTRHFAHFGLSLICSMLRMRRHSACLRCAFGVARRHRGHLLHRGADLLNARRLSRRTLCKRLTCRRNLPSSSLDLRRSGLYLAYEPRERLRHGVHCTNHLRNFVMRTNRDFSTRQVAIGNATDSFDHRRDGMNNAPCDDDAERKRSRHRNPGDRCDQNCIGLSRFRSFRSDPLAAISDGCHERLCVRTKLWADDAQCFIRGECERFLDFHHLIDALGIERCGVCEHTQTHRERCLCRVQSRCHRSRGVASLASQSLRIICIARLSTSEIAEERETRFEEAFVDLSQLERMERRVTRNR